MVRDLSRILLTFSQKSCNISRVELDLRDGKRTTEQGFYSPVRVPDKSAMPVVARLPKHCDFERGFQVLGANSGKDIEDGGDRVCADFARGYE